MPIVKPEALLEKPVDYVVIFPWNIAQEIKKQYSNRFDKKTIFVTFVPTIFQEEC